MATKIITERFGLARASVDRTGAFPVIRDVLLCGVSSKNKRRYQTSSFGTVTDKKYENKLVFLNHANRPGTPRHYEEKLGWVQNERRDASGRPIGDIGINPKHPYAESVLFDAEHRPNDCGMSHVAECQSRTASDGWEEVSQIMEVQSVDIVIGPATTNGFHEQGTRTMTTLKEWLPGFIKSPDSTTDEILKLKQVVEMAGDAEMTDEGGCSEAIRSACGAVLDEMMGSPEAVKEGVKKIRKLLGIHHGDKPAGEDDSGTEDKPSETPEQTRVKASPYEVLAECEKQGYRPGPGTLEYLTTCTPAARASFITEQKAAKPNTAERPKAPERKPGSGTAGTPVQPVPVAAGEQRAFPAIDL